MGIGGSKFRLRLGVGLQEDFSAALESEEEFAGVNSMPAEHALQPHMSDRLKELGDRSCVHAAAKVEFGELD